MTDTEFGDKWNSTIGMLDYTQHKPFLDYIVNLDNIFISASFSNEDRWEEIRKRCASYMRHRHLSENRMLTLKDYVNSALKKNYPVECCK